jgi:D-tagatose-1,6-bisphosphate aldolase subunit GatZ/KbaZ
MQEEYILEITSPEDAAETIALTRAAFESRGLENAWERVMGLVVQPGVEFGNDVIIEYAPEKTIELVRFIENQPQLVFEAHSTDYQTPSALHQMIDDHFAILKVGPALTYAFREAAFALEMIEEELLGNKPGVALSQLRHTLGEAMLSYPQHWQPYYSGSSSEQRLARCYSFSDRVRYYWTNSKVKSALKLLLRNLNEQSIPLSLLSQYLPKVYDKVRGHNIANKPGTIMRAKISTVLDGYPFN